MSSETLNFGPEWLRNLSHGGGGTNITTPPNSPAVNSMPTSKFKLAKHRYGREEMLALYDKDDQVIPESLKAVPHLFTLDIMIPLTLTPITAEDQAYSVGVNSENTYRQTRGFMPGGGGRGRGLNRGRGRGRGQPDSYSRSISQNEDGSYQRGLNYNRRDWDDRNNHRAAGVRHFDDPPQSSRNKPVRRADVSGNWRDDAMRNATGGGDTAESAPPHNRVGSNNNGNTTNTGGWRDANQRSWRESWTENNTSGGNSSAYRPPNRNHQPIRRSASTGPTTTSKYDNGGANNENNGNNFLPEWAGDDDGDSEVGVFDASGAFLPRSSVETTKKGSAATSENGGAGNGGDKKKARRQSTLQATTLDKIDEQNQQQNGSGTTTETRKTDHQSTPSGQSSPAAPSEKDVDSRKETVPTSTDEEKSTTNTPAVANENVNSTTTKHFSSPVKNNEITDTTTNVINSNVATPSPVKPQPPAVAAAVNEPQQPPSNDDASILRTSIMPNDVINNDDYVPKAIPNTFQDPKKDGGVAGVTELLSRSKMNENFDGLAESTIRILDEADDQLQQQQQQQLQQRTSYASLLHHQQQQQQHNEQQQHQQYDITTQHIKSLFAANQQPTVTTPQQSSHANKWFYKDPQGEIQGPFNSQQMSDWFKAGYFSSQLLIRRITDSHFEPLGDVFRRHGGKIPFTVQPVVQPVQHIPHQSQILDQQLHLRQQEINLRNFLQHQKEMQEHNFNAFKATLINHLNKSPEFCAMSVVQQQQALSSQLNIYQNQLLSQHNNSLQQYIANNTPSASITAHNVVASGGGGNAPVAAVTQSSVTANSVQPNSNQPASNTNVVQPTTPHHPDSLNPWEVDPAIVRRPSPGATQQEQQQFMNLLKKKTAEQNQRTAMKAREDFEMEKKFEEKRKLEMQRIQKDATLRNREEMRKQREMDLLLEQRIKEELARKEEEAKQKKIEEDKLRQKLAEEEAARLKKAEEERILKERALQEKKKFDEERKKIIEEQRKKKEEEEEEKKRKKRQEEEMEKKRREKEEEEAKRKAAEEENIRIQRELQLKEARKKKQLEDLKKLNLPSTAQWAQQNHTTPTSAQSRPTVAEIQKIEEEKQRVLKKKQEQEQKRIQMQQQAQKQSTTLAWGVNAAQHLAANNVNAAVSLAEIQREEAKKAKQKQETSQKPAATVTAKDSRASNANSSTKWSNRVASNVTSPATPVAPTIATTATITKKSGPAWGVPKTFQQTQFQSSVWADQQPTLAQSNDSKQFTKVRSKRRGNQVASEKNNVVAIFENSTDNPAKHSEVFLKWCTQEIGKIKIPNQVDIQTLVSFLCDVQSPYEVKDYIHDVFGDSQVSRDFGDAFLKKRAEISNSNNSSAAKSQIASANSRKSSDSAVVNNVATAANNAAAAAAAAQELVTGNTKRGKRRQRKLQKIDPSILGFSVNAASDRVNMGEIDTPRDV